MAAAPLTQRRLNRATLARQLLLERATVDVPTAVTRLGGLQAQEPKPPFLALWTRLEGFRREQLDAALHDRAVVRATTQRATLHLDGAPAYLALRGALQPVLSGSMAAALRGRDDGLELAQVLPAARALLEQEPRTFGELRALLAERFADVDERALGYAVRMSLPLAMVPTGDRWSFPADARFTPAEAWLGGELAPPDPATVARRHLAAFGPATAVDIQTWSGLGGMAAVLDGMRDELIELELGRRTYYDLPDAPRPDEDVAAPPRLLPEFDSLLLAHKDRTRVIADEHRRSLQTKNLRVKAVFLVDGVGAGSWSMARKGARATLTLAPFEPLARDVADALVAEAEALLEFAEPDAGERAVAISA